MFLAVFFGTPGLQETRPGSSIVADAFRETGGPGVRAVGVGFERRLLELPGGGRHRGCAAESRAGAPRRHGRESGFTLLELMVGVGIFFAVSLFLLQAFIQGVGITKKSDEKAAATSLALQIMERVSASTNPYTDVNFVSLARQPLPLPDPPYHGGILNPTPHTFQVSVVIARNVDLHLAYVTVNVYRLSDPDTQPFVSLTDSFHDQ